MLKTIIAFWFKKARWRFTGNLPKKHVKSIFIVAPNTRNSDFFLAVAIIKLTHFKARIMVDDKHFTLMKFLLLNHLGAYPFNYSDSRKSWTSLINNYNERKRFSVVFTPGRRKKCFENWDDGFHDLATKLEIPVVMVGVDRKRKTVKFHSLFYTSSDKERDLEYVKRWYEGNGWLHCENKLVENKAQFEKVVV